MMKNTVSENGFFFHTVVNTDFETTVENVRAALPLEGFGILTEIDFSGTMKLKLDKDIPNCLILGACNPAFGWEAYQQEPWIGIELPCNVVIRQLEDGKVEVAMKNPALLVEFTGNEVLRPMSEEIKARVRRVLGSLNGNYTDTGRLVRTHRGWPASFPAAPALSRNCSPCRRAIHVADGPVPTDAAAGSSLPWRR